MLIYRIIHYGNLLIKIRRKRKTLAREAFHRQGSVLIKNRVGEYYCFEVAGNPSLATFLINSMLVLDFWVILHFSYKHPESELRYPYLNGW